MANPTDAKAANAPYWNNDTVTANVALTGGFDAVTLTGYYVIVSNIGANNVWIGSNNTTQGILLAPGATFETAFALLRYRHRCAACHRAAVRGLDHAQLYETRRQSTDGANPLRYVGRCPVYVYGCSVRLG
jgi:hypothetical protein